MERSNGGATRDLEPDRDLIEWLHERGVASRVIFHLGTGADHSVGLDNHQSRANHILGVTDSVTDHAAYVALVRDDPTLALRYEVLLSNVYALSPQLLPTFDLVTLTHLNESAWARGLPHDEEALVDLFAAKLTPGGQLVFKSDEHTSELVAGVVARGDLRFVEENRSLLVYRRPF